MTSSRWTAEVEDPVTGDTTTLTADTEAEMDHLISQHLAETYGDADFYNSASAPTRPG